MSLKSLSAEDIKSASAEELIRAFSSWIKYIVRKYEGYLSRSGVLDKEDLYWSGAMALLESRETWDSDKGSFMTHSFFQIRSAIQKQIFFGKSEVEPQMVYLDAPLPDSEDETLIDLIPSDDKAMEERIEENELRDQLQAAMDRNCDSLEQKVLKKRFYEDLIIDEVANEMKLDPRIIKKYSSRSLNRLRRDGKLKSYVSPTYYRHVGLSQFNTTFTSEVEQAVIQKEAAYNLENGPGAFLMEDKMLQEHKRKKGYRERA